MRRIPIRELSPGQRFEQPLFGAAGQKLLGGGTPLTERHITALRMSGEIEVYLADDVGEIADERGPGVKPTRLRVGARAERAVVSAAGAVVLEEGDVVEPHHLEAVRAAGGEAFVAAGEASAEAMQKQRRAIADAAVDELRNAVAAERLSLRVEPAGRWPSGDQTDWPPLGALIEMREHAVQRIAKLFARAEAGLDTDADAFAEIVCQLIDLLRTHPRHFTQLALLCPRREDYLPDHAYTTAVLAMATAARLRWPAAAVQDLGLAALVFDLGMLLVPHRIRVGGSRLSRLDRSRVEKHPVWSLAMMQSIRGLPPAVQLAAVQHHERENGTGYPNAHRRDAIGDMARVLAVADCYAAATEPRHYRERKLPYAAMEDIVRHGAAGMFWPPAVRALVQAAGLYPVGSAVKLSTGATATVLATHPERADRPLVQPLDVDGRADGPPIDLASVKKGELAVVRAVAPPRRSAA